MLQEIKNTFELIGFEGTINNRTLNLVYCQNDNNGALKFNNIKSAFGFDQESIIDQTGYLLFFDSENFVVKLLSYDEV